MALGLQLVANKKHFSSPNIDEMWIVATPSLDSLLGRLESGELDFIESSKSPAATAIVL